MASLRRCAHMSEGETEGLFTPRKKVRLAVDWAELPDDLLVRTIDHLHSVEDFIMFSVVCRAWHRSAAACLGKLRLKWDRQMPWLMLTDGNEEIISDEVLMEGARYYTPEELKNLEDNDKIVEEKMEPTVMRPDDHTRYLLNFSRSKCYYSDNYVEAYGRSCWGSAYGWIVTTGLDHKMYLSNPLTKILFDLPSQRTLPGLWKNTATIMRNIFTTKAVVLKVPSATNDCDKGKETLLVVVMYDGALSKTAVARPGDTQWTGLTWSETKKDYLTDVLYDHDQGLLLFVSLRGGLVYCNIFDKEQPPLLKWYRPIWKYIVDNVVFKNFTETINYVVNVGKELLMVVRIIAMEKDDHGEPRDDDLSIDGYKTVDFKVYKLDSQTKEWDEVQDLRDVALFVGNNSTMSICAETAGCERNCIYFTDDRRLYYHTTKDGLGGNDMGVFKMDDRSIRLFSMGKNTRSTYCCPLWFIPVL